MFLSVSLKIYADISVIVKVDHSTFFSFVTTVLTVQFSKTTYTGSERSGVIPVTLILGGGTSSNKITVTVTPSDQSPVSAEGKVHISYYE